MNINPMNLMNSLRLGQQELYQLLEQIDSAESECTHPSREFVRWPYRIESTQLTVQHESSTKVSFMVATRNISRGGIAVLHSSFVHSGTKCEILLKLSTGVVESVTGVVVRCEHTRGRVHEIGINFDTQISTKELLGLDPLNEAYSLEQVAPERLNGAVLVVASEALDRDLVLTFLEDTNLTLDIASTVDGAVARIEKGYDLIIANYNIEYENAVELCKRLRAIGTDLPMIVMLTHKSEAILDELRDEGASGVLTKPISKYRLLQSLGEFLHSDGDVGPLYTSITEDYPIYPLVTKFIEDTFHSAIVLDKLAKGDDGEACLAVCRLLIGTAAPLGFPLISSLAGVVENELLSGDMKTAHTDIRALAAACRRVKARPAA